MITHGREGTPATYASVFGSCHMPPPLLRSHTVPRPIPPNAWYTEMNVWHNA